MSKPAAAQQEGSAQTSDADVAVAAASEEDDEHASATSKASEPASEPELAEAGRESAEAKPKTGAAQPEHREDGRAAAAAAAAAGAASKAGALAGAAGPRPPSKRRRVQGEGDGPCSRRHGVDSALDPTGRSSTATMRSRNQASRQFMHCQWLCARSCSVACVPVLICGSGSTGGGGAWLPPQMAPRRRPSL